MTTERAYISDSEAYDVFVGGITPQEFMQTFTPVYISAQEAVSEFIENACFDQEVPSWLESALTRYIEKAIEEEQYE